MSKEWKLLLIIVFLITVIVWLSVFSTSKNLKVITCNVGQGDASLIVYKNTEILIDGGPDNSVLECLSKYIPFWDRTIEVVVLTHPQKDHYMGLIDLFSHYRVKKILANSLDVGSQMDNLLKSQVLGQGTEWVKATSGTGVRYEMIQLDILYPSEEMFEDIFPDSNSQILKKNYFADISEAKDEAGDVNDVSVIALMTFSSFKFLFTGDAGAEILDSLATGGELGASKPVNYIKIPHHGSKTSISEKLYGIATSGIAVVSVGKNSWGHPHKEVLDLLAKYNIKTFRTDQVGDIVVESDGKRIWVINKQTLFDKISL